MVFRKFNIDSGGVEMYMCMVCWFQDYIARFGHGSAKLARQAQSKEKTLKKMVESGLTEKVGSDKVWSTYICLEFTMTVKLTYLGV